LDFSECYIKMCQRAEEIQNHVVGYGDYVQLTFEDGPFIASAVLKDAIPKDRIIWLPRQDQLQEMITIYDMATLMVKIGKFYKNNNFDTFEKLWLAFIMYEFYNKLWNGQDWVKEE
jgi:hypothetical protein